MRKLLTGLRTEIILYIAVLMIVSTALIGFVVLNVSKQAVLEQKVKSARVILNSIQSSLRYAEPYPNSADAAGIQRLVDVFIEGGGIDSILVTDKDMRIIAHSSHEETGKPHSEEALLKAIKEKRVVTGIRGGSVGISSPLYIRNEVSGGIKVMLSARDVLETAARSQRLIFFYIVLNSLVIVVFGSILLSRTIVKPIDELVKVTEAVAGGDLNQRIRVRRSNEIGLLSESFNRMTERLRSGKEALEGNIRSLERAHDDIKKAQDEVIRAEKMASVGRLAAGIAHEIGNPLGAILGYTNILQGVVSKEDEADYLRRIEREIQRINRIVLGLLDYARPGDHKIVDVDVNGIIRNSVDIVSSQKGFERFDIKLMLDDIPMVKAESHQLQQVLINLLINASDAMPDGGTLTVKSGVRSMKGTVPDLRTSRREVVESGLSPKKTGEYVEISVSDTGTGISEEEIEKIFDPFFTTKEPGKGTGLGLAICQRIIESFGGRIEVASKRGEGSRFTVLLPVKE